MTKTEEYLRARKVLAKRVCLAKNSARMHGCLGKFRRDYLQMMDKNAGFNMAFGIGRCPKTTKGW